MSDHERRIVTTTISKCSECDSFDWGMDGSQIKAYCRAEDEFIEGINPDELGSFPDICLLEIYDDTQF